MNNAIVDVRNVSITIDTFQGPLRVIRNQDISLQPGEILGIVGESGCGKSVLVNSLMGLLPYGKTKIKADTFMIDGNDCLEFTEDDWNELRGTTVAMVFQDPMTSLNPIMTIGEQLYEVIHSTNAYGEDYDERAIAIDLLKKMGLSTPERRLSQYPHELSGGMRQRVCIAMAVAGRPKRLVLGLSLFLITYVLSLKFAIALWLCMLVNVLNLLQWRAYLMNLAIRTH